MNNTLTPFLLEDRPDIDPSKPDPIDYLTLQLGPETVDIKLRSGPGNGSWQEILPTGLFENGRGSVHRADGKTSTLRSGL
jgi:hypothetical protein